MRHAITPGHTTHAAASATAPKDGPKGELVDDACCTSPGRWKGMLASCAMGASLYRRA